jgi:hypothetical protein
VSPPGAPRAADTKSSPRRSEVAAATRGGGAQGSAQGSDWREHLPAAFLVVLGLVLYGRGLLLGYVGDDYKLLDAALRTPLGELLSGRHGILGYYRPVSRELYFWLWGRTLDLGPGGFHLVNALTFAAVVVMIDRLGRTWAGARAGRLAALAFVLFPPGSALLSWISCAQDLIMLFWAAAALLLYARGRHTLSGLATVLAVLSKETAVALPLAFVVMDFQLHPGATSRGRLSRLAPPWLGVALAAGLSLAARSTWPAGTAVTVWSPRQFVNAWRLPLDFARALFPPDTGAGIAAALTAQPAWLLVIALATALAVPRAATAPARAVRVARAGERAPRGRSLVIFGLALAVLAMLPVGFVSERWRSYFFSLAAIGGALAAGVGLAPLPAPVTRAALALLAVINFGAGGIYRPVESAAGPARHPHVNYAFFRDTGALSTQILAALAPWCASIRALPRTFAAGLPPDEVFATALGPGLRVTCRDTVDRVRFLAEFAPADAATEFGVLRFEPRAQRFVFERADRTVRARVGEGFLIHARFDVAAACFEAAARESLDRELSYPLAVSLTAAGRDLEARARWAEAQRNRQVLGTRTMAERLARSPAPGAGAGRDTLGPAALEPLAGAVLRAPWEIEPHRALGRELLERGHAREATLELAAAAGISHQNADLAILARGYEAMGLIDEAVAGYRRALSAGLAAPLYEQTRDRLFGLMQGAGTSLDRSVTHP